MNQYNVLPDMVRLLNAIAGARPPFYQENMTRM